MQLIELVKRLKGIEEAKELASKELPEVEFDMVELYMVKEITINSEIKFFDADSISNTLEIEQDGIKYVNLFPLNLIQEMVEEYAKSKEKVYSDEYIAKRLLEYRLKDA